MLICSWLILEIKTNEKIGTYKNDYGLFVKL